ncbi:claudin-18 [Labeo rohita]|uniref:claudin-18 n=1 Tax=Labeo rohita TaxID=84645 RepID=UPI0021E1D9F2|nr:claudin-18 [Labeo rohita]
MTSQALQTAGFVTGAVGTVGVLAATIMDVWCTDHSENDPASNSHYRGLWKDCEVAESGLAECQSFNSHLSFTRILQAVRALMVLAIILGVIAVVIGCFCLNCINVRSMNTTARSKLVLAAGILFIIAGVFDISGSSVYADQLVPSFMVRSPARSTHKSEETGAILCQNGMGMGQITSQDTGKGTGPGHFQVHGQVHGQVYGQGQGQGQVYGQGQGQGQGQVYGQGQGQGMGMGMGSGTGMVRYTFGAALYIAWVAGVLLILAGILKCISFKTMQLIGDTREAYIYNATAQCRGAEEENRLQRIRGDQQQQI